MTIREAKNEGIDKLCNFDDEAAIDVEILLSHCLGISREELLAHDERRVPAFALRRYRILIAHRRKHEPVAYLVGHREFFGLQFEVNKHTLIPRPETELLVEETLRLINHKSQQPNYKKIQNSKIINFKPFIIDVGTGSGAIAIAVAKNSDATVIATDSSKQALKIAERNAIGNDVAERIDFRRADLLQGQSPYRGTVPVIIVANLPYIPTADWGKCMPDVKNFEPRAALDGGPDGLRVYDRLFHQIIAFDIKPAAIICEIDPSQKKSFPKLVKKHFSSAKTEIKKDLAGLPRVAITILNYK